MASSPVSGAELVDKDHALALALGRQEEEGRERDQVIHLNLCSVPVQCICTVDLSPYLYSVPVQCTCTVYLYLYLQEWQDFKEHLGSSEGMTDAQLAARLQVHPCNLYSSPGAAQ